MKYPWRYGYGYDTAFHGWYGPDGEPVSEETVNVAMARYDAAQRDIAIRTEQAAQRREMDSAMRGHVEVQL